MELNPFVKRENDSQIWYVLGPRWAAYRRPQDFLYPGALLPRGLDRKEENPSKPSMHTGAVSSFFWEVRPQHARREA